MNSMDRADHLRKDYSMREGLRQRKWWFSIFLWGLDVAMLNAYLVYKSWMEMHKMTPKSHYRFRESVVEAWMDSENFWKDRYPKRSRRTPVGLSGKSKDQLTAGSISSLSRQTRSTVISPPKKKVADN